MSLKPHHLRLGNLIKIHGVEEMVEELSSTCISTESYLVSISHDSPIFNIEGIDLDEIQLIKFKFEYDSNENSWLSPWIKNSRIKISYKNNCFNYHPNIFETIEIKFVHELQNLIFCLKQTEL